MWSVREGMPVPGDIDRKNVRLPGRTENRFTSIARSWAYTRPEESVATGLVDVPDLPGRVTVESGNQRGCGLFGSDQHPRLLELDELAAQFLANPFSWLTSDPVVDGGVDDSGPEGVDGDSRVGEFGGQVQRVCFQDQKSTRLN